MKKIFQYDDYRKALEDYYLEQKKKNPSTFSFRAFSKRAGFQTSNFIHLVINNKRNISLESAQKIARVMGLKGNQAQYFENLVQFNQSTDLNEKSNLFRSLISFKNYREARLISGKGNIYFTKWYYTVVREMVNLKGFKPEPKWIASCIQPNISKEEASEALQVLKELGYIKVQPDGKWVLDEPQIKTEDDSTGYELVAFHQKMINLGSNSLRLPPDKRFVSGMTMSISERQFQQIRQKILLFEEDIRRCLGDHTFDSSLCAQDEITMVCQLNIQHFPLFNKGGAPCLKK